MSRSLPAAVLAALLGLWLLAALPALVGQARRAGDIQRLLAGRSAAEAAEMFDHPAFSVAAEIASRTPPDACVTVLAYAGPDALAYYDARLNYLLYPRRVDVSGDTVAGQHDCHYLALFRDSPENLQASLFRGEWDEGQLRRRLSGYERLNPDGPALVYRRR